ncbi:MAG: hypothetical protein F4Z71_00790 [Gammaproteobacteria bacterium]|nr:hypothetical protein [Gammaproteobacteria bacterium]MYE28601.1 hypothetical protein [Gammaproteobacteria bacterium]
MKPQAKKNWYQLELMSISVEILDDGAVFHYPPEYDFCYRQFDKLLDQRDAEEISDKEYLRRLGELTRKYPQFIDGHAHIGFEQLGRGRVRAALKSFERGFKLGEAALPEDFDGAVKWTFLDNRPFLRAVGGMAESLIALDDKVKAIKLIEMIIAWDENDHQGWRFQIGSEYLRAGRAEQALEIFENNSEEYPPYWYELGLYWLMRQNFAKAATCLRRGFRSNPYVPETLFGTDLILPLPIWHGSNFNRASTALAYAKAYGALWEENLEAMEFLRWLQGHPKALAERAAIFECREALMWERDVAKRGQILDREKSLFSEMDDRLSEQMVSTRVDRHGKEVLPWTVPTIELLETLD